MLTRVKARLVRAPRAVFSPPYAKGSANTRAFSRPLVAVDLAGLAKEVEAAAKKLTKAQRSKGGKKGGKKGLGVKKGTFKRVGRRGRKLLDQDTPRGRCNGKKCKMVGELGKLHNVWNKEKKKPVHCGYFTLPL